ncbi:MAG: aldose epimerase family protein [Akkermansiaceae bacterium]|jgi:aldose 1-epimerase
MMIFSFLAIIVGLVGPLLAGPVVSDFGETKTGEVVKKIALENKQGMKVEIITYGATIKGIFVPDREGTPGNVVDTANSIEDYEKFNAAASVIGRVANRIKGARFELDGEVFNLTKNSGENCIHGGKPGFDRVVWKLESRDQAAASASVVLSYLSKDGEAGFPGNLLTKVTYSLTDKNELKIQYHATTDRATVVNLTNHAYFNFSGKGTALDHVLWIPSKSYTPAGEGSIPTGEILPLAGTPMDFNEPTRIGARIAQLKPAMNGYDHNFILGEGKGLKLAARLHDPASGRTMEVRTTQPAIQLYSGNHLEYRAVCLETQHYPDSVNHAHFPSTVIRPGQDYHEEAVLRFFVQ